VSTTTTTTTTTNDTPATAAPTSTTVDLKDIKQDSSSNTSVFTDLGATAAVKESPSFTASLATTVVADVRSPAKSVDLVSSKKDSKATRYSGSFKCGLNLKYAATFRAGRSIV